MQLLTWHVLLALSKVLYTLLLMHVAVGLTILPLQEKFLMYWPLWPSILAILWSFCFSYKIVILPIFGMGLILDHFTHACAGTHALALLTVNYFSYCCFSEERSFPIEKVTYIVTLCSLFIIYQLLLWSIQRITLVPVSKFPQHILIHAVISTMIYLISINTIRAGYQRLTPRHALIEFIIQWIKSAS